ncbi:hypothetical protein AAC387_Pa10g1706 [Persea americana]
MPSKLRKAIAVVKDQTSISLAKVSSTNSSNLDVAVLKATTHDEVIEDRHVHEVLLLTSSSPQCASACVHALARRLARTKNWMVALKSLTLTFKILQQGDPHFAQEVLRTMKRGATILNLSNFRDDSNSSPWDYTAFVRTFALYLEERLGCCLMGKLHEGHRHGSRGGIRDMKPDVLLDRMDYWHRLLDRALATRPTGSSRSNRLVQSSLHYVVRESFDIYHDMSDGLTVLLENFQLQHHSCVEAAHICIKVSRQFDELAEFYTLCKGLGIGSRSEYPSVKKISEKDLETLETFLKDDAKSHHRSNSKGEREFPIGREESMAGLDSPLQNMEEKRDWGSQINSPEEDFKDVNEAIASTSSLGDQDSFNDLLDMRTDATDTCVSSSGGREDNLLSLDSSSDVVLFVDRNKQHAAEENNSCMDLVFFNDDLQQPPQQPGIQQSNPSPYSGLDLALFNDEQNMSQKQQQLRPTSPSPITTTIAGEGCWEMVLAETASDVNQVNHGGWELSHKDNFHNYQNPFLQGRDESSPFAMPHMGSLPPPTFNAKNPDQASILPPEADPFSHLYCMASPTGSHCYDISYAKSPLAIH